MATETINISKLSRQGGVAVSSWLTGFDTSLWQFDGTLGSGATPGAWANPDNTTAGSLRQSNATGGTQKWLIAATMSDVQLGRHLVYDRLLHVGGFSGTNTSVQNVNGGSDATFSRTYSTTDGTTTINGCGNRIYAEIYTAVGTTATTITAQYKNHAGALKTTQAVAFGGANRNVANRIIELPLAQGDLGVTAIVSCTLAGSTVSAAGNFGLTVAHRLIEFESAGSLHAEQWIGNLLIPDGACIAFLANSTANVSGGGASWAARGSFTFVEK